MLPMTATSSSTVTASPAEETNASEKTKQKLNHLWNEKALKETMKITKDGNPKPLIVISTSFNS